MLTLQINERFFSSLDKFALSARLRGLFLDEVRLLTRFPAIIMSMDHVVLTDQPMQCSQSVAAKDLAKDSNYVT